MDSLRTLERELAGLGADAHSLVPSHPAVRSAIAVLQSPDPAVRDEGGLGLLNRHLEAHRNTPALAMAWCESLAAHLAVEDLRGLGEPVRTLRISFCALVIADALDSAGLAFVPEVEQRLEAVRAGLLAAHAWAKETRGETRALGWIHLDAHLADALGALAAVEGPDRPSRCARIADAVQIIVGRRRGHIYGHDEDDRLGQALALALRGLGPLEADRVYSRIVRQAYGTQDEVNTLHLVRSAFVKAYSLADSDADARRLVAFSRVLAMPWNASQDAKAE